MASTEGFGRDVQRLASYFYAYNVILASTRATHLQRAFDTMTELFGHVCLRTNVANMVIIAY